jgi:hypothetical protein
MPAAVKRNAIAAFRHRFTLRQTRRTVPIMFPIELVQASERLLYRQAEAVDNQHLLEPFEDAGGDTRRLLVKPTGEIAHQPLGFISIIELPSLPERTADRRMQRACTMAAFSVAPSSRASGCLWPAPSMPRAATSTSSLLKNSNSDVLCAIFESKA